MAKAFKVGDKRYWRIKVFGLAEAGLWEVLSDFADKKKSPIGYSPFVEAAIKYHNRNEALIFVRKMSDTEERLHCALKWSLLEVAVECAAKLKDVETLLQIINLSKTDAVKNEAKRCIAIIEGNKH